MTLVDIVDQFLSILTLISSIIIVLFILNLTSKKLFKKELFSSLWKLMKKHSLKLSFLVALTATLGSLFYSEVALYNPCKLCWLQRIFMYPLILLFGSLVFTKSKNYIKSTSIFIYLMSFIGGIIALIHYISQITKSPALGCPIIGYSESCAEYFVLSYGYVTIPMMALVAFILILILNKFYKQ